MWFSYLRVVYILFGEVVDGWLVIEVVFDDVILLIVEIEEIVEFGFIFLLFELLIVVIFVYNKRKKK